MNFIQELVEKVKDDKYFEKLLNLAEYNYGLLFLENDSSGRLTEKEYFDLMRYADILSRDNDSYGRNMAMKIISTLYPFYNEDDYYKFISNSIMIKLGNFSSLKLILGNSNCDTYDTAENKIEKSVKEVYQQVPGENKVFTDAQYKLFEAIKESNHYSYSAPTSFGKSFIMDAFIKFVIEERKGIDNIVILVPTRALINQVSKRLKKMVDQGQYIVLSHPAIPLMYAGDEKHYIFVFTPERLIAYLSNISNPPITYMFVDEAQKIVAEKDSRAPIYYQAISMADRKSIKLYFGSPNIPNCNIFLRLFDKSTDESMSIDEKAVSQNRFFIDFVDKRVCMYRESKQDAYYNFGEYNTFNELLLGLGKSYKNIIYCNGVDDTVEYALSFAELLDNKNDKRIDELIEYIQGNVHKDYYLIDCLRKGVAFHFGRLPQRIREKIEELFEDKIIDYMFCTSTLLEGVNLPAQNIFILNNVKGARCFSDIDFWNLAGRAGRLSKELFGNIICVRLEESKWRTNDDYEMIRSGKISDVEPIILSGKKNFYKNIENAIENKPFTRKNSTKDEELIWNQYANIVYCQEVTKAESVLKNTFIKKNASSASKVLADIEKNNQVPGRVLEQCITIKPKYQNRLLEDIECERSAFPEEVSYDSCYEVLKYLCERYNWLEEESKGRSPFLRNREQLKYYAVLMYDWIEAKPMNFMIENMISYYTKRGYIWRTKEYIKFNPKDRKHINWIINDLVSDIDRNIRFKLKNYFMNYYLLVCEKNGDKIAGDNWAEFLEYGTCDKNVIELQNIGMSRNIAVIINNSFRQVLVYEDDSISEIKYDLLAMLLRENGYRHELEELSELVQLEDYID